MKLTKSKPKYCIELDDKNNRITPGYRYLYTDTGSATVWAIAMKVFFKEDENPKKEIVIDINIERGDD